MITAKFANNLDTAVLDVISNYNPARRQLEQWTGEYRAATIGASAPTSRSDPFEKDHVSLTTVERQALIKDKAQLTLMQMETRLIHLSDTGRYLWADIDGTPIQEPTDTAARLAVTLWTVRRCINNRHAVNRHQLNSFRINLEWLQDTCNMHLPPPATTTIIHCCHAHQAAGLESEINPHFRRHHLCRWCGRFRASHGVNPPPMLVKLHDRGIKVTSSHIRRAGVKTPG